MEGRVGSTEHDVNDPKATFRRFFKDMITKGQGVIGKSTGRTLRRERFSPNREVSRRNFTNLAVAADGGFEGRNRPENLDCR